MGDALLRDTPDPTVSSASRAAPHPDVAMAARVAGPMRVNRWTLPVLRFLMGSAPMPHDASGVLRTTHREPRLDVHRPEDQTGRGALLLFHGGGYVMGGPADVAPKAARIARACGVPVVAPAYALGPERPFPAGLDDAHAAWKWLLGQADALGVDQARIAIGGISAGGGLAASLAQRLRDEGGVQPAAQLLVYPMLDDRTAARAELDEPRHPVWDNRSNRFGWTGWLGGPPGQAEVPRYAVPARVPDLSGLPPAWIGVGTPDLFLSLPLGLGALHALLLAGVALPLFGEVAGYLGASMGALSLGLGALALGVALRPERARWTALPLSLVFFGLAVVRLATSAFGSALQEAGLGPVVAAEVVLFSLVGTAVGVSWPGAMPFGALGRRFLSQLPRLPRILKARVVLLVASIFVAPVLAWGHAAAPVMLLAQAVNLLGFVLYVHMGGLVRGLGLSHVVAWAVPVGLAAVEAAALGTPGDVGGVALWAMVVVPGARLVVDAVDLVRWGMGERGELVGAPAGGVTPPSAASRTGPARPPAS